MINNSGRLVTLKKGRNVYLKFEPQLIRLVNLGFIQEVVEIKTKEAPPKSEPKLEKKYKAKKEAETLEQE